MSFWGIFYWHFLTDALTLFFFYDSHQIFWHFVVIVKYSLAICIVSLCFQVCFYTLFDNLYMFLFFPLQICSAILYFSFSGDYQIWHLTSWSWSNFIIQYIPGVKGRTDFNLVYTVIKRTGVLVRCSCRTGMLCLKKDMRNMVKEKTRKILRIFFLKNINKSGKR